MTEASRASVAGALETVLATCAVGRSRVVLIEGAAGCGKSHLLDAVAERAADAGALVLTAVATEAERRVPLGVLRQLVAGAPVSALPHSSAEGARTFCAQLCRLALDGPVVLCLDDVQHADTQSLHHLRHLVRHARPAPVLMVATVSAYADGPESPFPAPELERQPHVRQIRLGLLSPQETAAAAAPRPGRTPAELHRISGGNPLLLRALLAEDAAASPPPAPAPGGPFAEAALACLHRSGPAAPAAARAVAILADRATEPLVERMLERPGADGLAALRACGLLDGLVFRHPAVPVAVLADASPRARAALHRRAALVLHTAGAPAEAVADHLLAPPADGVRTPVRPEDATLLAQTAEDLLRKHPAGHRTAQAERLLELAHAICPDESARAAVALRLAQTATRRTPQAAEQRLTALALTTGPRTRRPDAAHTRELAAMLLAHGRLTDATALQSEPAGSPWDTLLDARPATCETLLRSTRLTDATYAPLVLAVRTLLYADRAERAVAASRRLLEEAEASGAPGRHTVFATLHAEALLRVGEVHDAHTHATAALEALPPGGGGTFRYAPTAVLVQACGALGRRDEAAEHVQHPVTRRVLTSLYGLQYLRARGLHHLSLGRPHTALADFRRIGRLLYLWRADRPAFLPWRTDAAQALLRLGRPREARALAEEQLTLPDARRPWVRGQCLRVLAATGRPADRTALLREAVDQLRRAGARLETAHAVADLGHALHEIGAPAQEEAAFRAELLPIPTPLSEAEHRVAQLATQGLTNRQIAAHLHLTVSTVEQHLTRTYRKLGVAGRAGLPAGLNSGAAASG
ncbi:AAA family ATPase [Streptomyces sp. NPDC002619]|uniref:helix-turn-helix transcriptional regulator n=1 Tax=Streptomyces sp. NPDC002619 TaxID=3364655 RepID=UPI003696B491